MNSYIEIDGDRREISNLGDDQVDAKPQYGRLCLPAIGTLCDGEETRRVLVTKRMSPTLYFEDYDPKRPMAVISHFENRPIRGCDAEINKAELRKMNTEDQSLVLCAAYAVLEEIFFEVTPEAKSKCKYLTERQARIEQQPPPSEIVSTPAESEAR